MIHVYPVSEQHAHELEGTLCPCGPEVDWSEPEAIVTHNRLGPAPPPLRVVPLGWVPWPPPITRAGDPPPPARWAP